VHLDSGPDLDFATRARTEAARYGDDPWVFVRELLQNARDAGADRVELRITVTEGIERLVCRDNGDGMTLDHARRFLFTLYASSKRSGADTAGRFGVGFWSILRFSPSAVTVRSRPAGGNGWEVRLDLTAGAESRVVSGPWAGAAGTEVELERSAPSSHASGSESEAAVVAAVRRDAPFLGRLGRPDRPIDIRVGGRRVTAPLELPPPALSFSRRGLRGAVGVGTVPRVDVFAHGLRVRTAASLGELLEGEPRAPAASDLGPAGGAAPRVILDGDRLQVLLARGDARSDRELNRVVAVARRELDRLLRRQLDRVAPLGIAAQIAHGARRFGRWLVDHRRTVAGAAAGLVVVVAVVSWVAFGGRWPTVPVLARPAADPSRSVGRNPAAVVAPHDLARGYGGPSTGGLGTGLEPATVTYAPPTATPWLTFLRLTRPVPIAAGEDDLVVDDGPPCPGDCLELEMTVSANGWARLAEPTGWRLDPASLAVDGETVVAHRTSAGDVVIEVSDSGTKYVRWRVGRAPGPALAAPSRWPPLPADAAAVVLALADRPDHEVFDAVARWVADRVRYDLSPEVARRYGALEPRDDRLFDEMLAVGAGDCDQQNALVTAMLVAAGRDARLAIGWIGHGGRFDGGLHAWVEARGGDGRWQVVDASLIGGAAVASEATGPLSSGNPSADAAAVGRRSIEPSAPAVAADVVAEVGPWAMVRDPATAVGLVAIAAVLVVALVVSLRRRGGRRRLRLDDGLPLEELIRGAILRPDGLGSSADLVHRRLLPVHGGPPVSLSRCHRHHRAGRLLASHRPIPAATGVIVLDASHGAARVAAELLGAVDLDLWQPVIDRAEPPSTAPRLEAAFAAAGVSVRLLVATDAPQSAVAYAVPTAGGRHLSRTVCFDPERSPWRRSHSAADPVAAVVNAAEVMIALLGLDRQVRRRVLRSLSRDLLLDPEVG
jgi:hypothetical protein